MKQAIVAAMLILSACGIDRDPCVCPRHTDTIVSFIRVGNASVPHFIPVTTIDHTPDCNHRFQAKKDAAGQARKEAWRIRRIQMAEEKEETGHSTATK